MQHIVNRQPGDVDDLAKHLAQVVRALTTGRLVPFLGAGANQCARTGKRGWQIGQTQSLPLGSELVGHLAKAFGLTFPRSLDLAQASERVVLASGGTGGPLFDELHSLFNANYIITSLHRYFAGLPARLRAKGLPKATDALDRSRLVLVSTNFDDLLERAFAEADQPCHVVFYEAGKGQFFHRSPDCDAKPITRPNEYKGFRLDEHPIVVKLHGTIDRDNRDRDSYVITEDHFIDYLARPDIGTLLPQPLPAILRNCSFLFLGYALKDWNLRVFLRRLSAESKVSRPWWAVMRDPDSLDRLFWDHHGVKLIDHDVCSYIAALEAVTP